MLLRKALVGLGLLASATQGIELDLDSEDSIKTAASDIAYGLMASWYHGNKTGDVPGNLPDPYYWWVCGAMFGTLIDYWHFTGDDSYNEVVRQGMIHQMGEVGDFMPDNQTRTMGNDDQGFWAVAAMSAAEFVLEDPPAPKPSWIAVVQGVFFKFVERWNTETCDGGLIWQVYDFNIGYDYKNSISNGCFFQIAARLARYTGNETYSEWAEKIWDWEEDVGLITSEYAVQDGTHYDKFPGNCTAGIDHTEWSYNSGIFMYGAAVMFDLTNDTKWEDRAVGIYKHGMEEFAKQRVMFEPVCEPGGFCDEDQETFKGYFLRWLAGTLQMIPRLHDEAIETIRASATAAASVCIGTGPDWNGHPSQACGFSWIPEGEFDSLIGVGQQMNAMSAIMYLLTDQAEKPKTINTGGESEGDPLVGTPDDERIRIFEPITMGDRVGAGILTTFVIAGLIAGSAFVVTTGLE